MKARYGEGDLVVQVGQVTVRVHRAAWEIHGRYREMYGDVGRCRSVSECTELPGQGEGEGQAANPNPEPNPSPSPNPNLS